MSTPDPVPPRMLGRYALYEKIASGGMASVHIGRLLGPVGFARTVAIKRMHPQFAEDAEFVAMFLDEARLAARIRHPNVVSTLDVVATSGELFLVMDFIQGESLARLTRAATARGERIPRDMVVTIMVGVLHGLHAAHEAKSEQGEPLEIVHRDVSPQNILVGTDGVARVLDFGVAKAAGRAQTTRDGQLKGKLAYMAPEQIRGSVTRVTDVYAASVVFWEALTGKRLFQGDNDAHVLDQVLHGATSPPSAHVEGLSPAIDELTMRGLSVDPLKRFATARDMARALELAMPLATTSSIGDWVEAAAKTTLDERHARIATIESSSPVAPELEVAVDIEVEPTQVELSSGVQARSTPEVLPTLPSKSAGDPQISSASVSLPRRVSLVPRGRTQWVAGAAGAALLAGTSLFVGASWHPGAVSSAATGAPNGSPSSVLATAPPVAMGTGSTDPTASPALASDAAPARPLPPARTKNVVPAGVGKRVKPVNPLDLPFK